MPAAAVAPCTLRRTQCTPARPTQPLADLLPDLPASCWSVLYSLLLTLSPALASFSHRTAPLFLLSAEDAALDFTDGTSAEAATVAADFGQKSLIDVDEDISYDDEEEEVSLVCH